MNIATVMLKAGFKNNLLKTAKKLNGKKYLLLQNLLLVSFSVECNMFVRM